MTETRLFQHISRWMHSKERQAPLDSPEAFSALYAQFHLSVYRYLYGLHNGPVEDVEDLAAETFLRAWKARASFAGDPHTDGVGWLLRIARHLAIDEYRRSAARVRPEDASLEELPALGPTPERAVMGDEQRHALRTALTHLPAETREMLVLRYLLDWQVRQIAEYLGVQENTVSVAIRRALVRLRRDWPHGKE